MVVGVVRSGHQQLTDKFVREAECGGGVVGDLLGDVVEGWPCILLVMLVRRGSGSASCKQQPTHWLSNRLVSFHPQAFSHESCP